jgi:hypothetical protein
MTFAATKNPLRRWPVFWRALETLAGCPEGCTGPRLEQMGFGMHLDELVADGFLWRVHRTFANPPGLEVEHYFITAAGKDALAAQQRKHPK